jgi:putative nucleotidyltransferase with HDIG domain
MTSLRRGDVLIRGGMACIAILAMLWIAHAWQPPFKFNNGYVPTRNIISRVTFREPDLHATERARDKAVAQVPYVFILHTDPLVQLRASLQRRIVEISAAAHLADLGLGVWQEFHPSMAAAKNEAETEEQEASFQQFRSALSALGTPDDFDRSVARALGPFEQRGLLDKLPPELDKGNQVDINVHMKDRPSDRQLVKVTDVLIGDGQVILKSLQAALKDPLVADRIFTWVKPRLPSTLELDLASTDADRLAAGAAVPEQFRDYEIGHTLAHAGQPLGPEQLKLLALEHEAYVAQTTPQHWIGRSLAVSGLMAGLFLLCGYYLRYRDRQILRSWRRYSALLVLTVATVAAANWMQVEPARAELVPMMMFGMILAIAFGQDIALVLSVTLGLILVVTLGIGPMLGELLILCGTTAAAILMLARVRSRPKLIQVGFLSAIAAFFLTVGAGILEEQPLSSALAWSAARNALWAFGAGFLMSGTLPFVENFFGVLTDIKLLELGDVAHPLLQELVRRAPGTYNHSINVAAIAEAAADAIHARGLLVRVGAYFHDIGKMLKPGYFVENMGADSNRHDSLVPAMSTLIIIAHIKDGADLARQHNLPQPIIDFIEQHHGTTLVEYFFRRANEQREADPDGAEVDERLFRYPGPKPQTKEAAVLMLADAVESACRALEETTPARIERLVSDIALKRLLDGQFDESGITLRELRTVQESLVKSLTAVYHGRVKYPSQRTA